MRAKFNAHLQTLKAKYVEFKKFLYVLRITAGFLAYVIFICVVVSSPLWYPIYQSLNR